MLEHMSEFHSFLWPNTIPSCGYTTFYLSVHELMDTFQLLQVLLWTFLGFHKPCRWFQGMWTLENHYCSWVRTRGGHRQVFLVKREHHRSFSHKSRWKRKNLGSGIRWWVPMHCCWDERKGYVETAEGKEALVIMELLTFWPLASCLYFSSVSLCSEGHLGS